MLYHRLEITHDQILKTLLQGDNDDRTDWDTDWKQHTYYDKKSGKIYVTDHGLLWLTMRYPWTMRRYKVIPVGELKSS